MIRWRSLAEVTHTEPDSNSAAPRRTWQLNMDADLRLPTARRYSADRPDSNN